MSLAEHEKMHATRLLNAIALRRAVIGCHVDVLDSDQMTDLRRIIREVTEQVPDYFIERIAAQLSIDAKYYDGLNYGGSPTKVREPRAAHGWYITDCGGEENQDGLADGFKFSTRMAALRMGITECQACVEGVDSTPGGDGLIRLL